MDRARGTKAAPGASELLRAALEKIVFFEWRVSELAAELASAQARAEASVRARSEAEEAARAASAQAQAARNELAEMEAERARLATLLSRPREGAIPGALEAERSRTAALADELRAAREEIARQRDERQRLLNEMIVQARSGEEGPAALAQFISELRGEVIALREQKREAEVRLAQAGLPLPAPTVPTPPAAPLAQANALDTARAFLQEGRLGDTEPGRIAQGSNLRGPSAARALADQCLRGLSASDAARRLRAARHLAEVPVDDAAPALAVALGREEEPKARAAIARALAACGGEAAADLVDRLQEECEHPLVRMAALEALAARGGERAAKAIGRAAADLSPRVRRRAAALAATQGDEAVLARLSADRDPAVRAAVAAARAPPPAPAPKPTPLPTRLAEAAAPEPPPAAVATPPAGALAKAALDAVRVAIFGLTEAELAQAVGAPASDAAPLASRLVSEGWLSRRGRRLVAARTADERGA